MRRTNNDIFRHLEELILENEQLRLENKKLRAENSGIKAENTRLCERIKVLEVTMEERISKAVEEAVTKAAKPLYAIIAEKDKEILRLNCCTAHLRICDIESGMSVTKYHILSVRRQVQIQHGIYQ